MIINTGTIKNNIQKNVIDYKTKETFSSRLINHVEPNIISGVEKTKFHTEINTNLSVDDKVFIVNGNYRNSKLIEDYLYNKYSTGYKILEIDKTEITIDYDYTAVLPKETADFNDENKFIKVYTVNNNREADYYDYITSNMEGELGGLPRFEYIPNIPSATINDIIYNNSGGIIFSIYGPILPNTFYSYSTFSPGDKLPILDSEILFEMNTNGKSLFCMEKFQMVSGLSNNVVDLEKGKVYILNGTEMISDIRYEDVFLSRSNFRFGNFKSGTWNDGIFGKRKNSISDKMVYWEGAKWRNGIFYNSKWRNGIMESKSDSIKQQSFYSELDDFGSIKKSTDFTNNKTFGYNYIFESNIDNITIKNANVFDTDFGTISTTYSVNSEYYLSGINKSIISIENGAYINSNFGYSNIFGGSFDTSNVINSNVNGGKILDTNVKDSIITNSEYVNYGSVNIIDYDKQFYRLLDSGLKRIGITHKFYISDSDYLKISEGDSITFNNLITDKLGVDTLFEKEYFIGVGLASNTNGFNHGYLDNNHEVIVDLRPKSKNNTKFEIVSGTTSFIVNKVSNDKLYNSLDLTFIVSYINPTTVGTYITATSSNDYDYIYNEIIQKNEDYRSSVIIYDDAKIQISKLSNSVFKDSTWTKGSKETNEDFSINYNGVFGNFTPDITILGAFNNYSLSVGVTFSYNRDLYDSNMLTGKVVQLNNITYTQGTQSYDISGSYKVGNFITSPPIIKVVLSEYGTVSNLNIGITFSGGTFSYHNTSFLNNSLFDLDIDNSDINGGRFRRQFFNNSIILNKDIDVFDKSLSIDNLNKLKIYRSLLSKSDNLVIDKSFIHQSVLTGVTVSNTLVYNSLLYESKWNNGLLLKSHWDSGTFDGGVLDGLVGDDLIGIDEWFFDKSSKFPLPQTLEDKPYWISGDFNNGNIINSLWRNGTFNNGKFYKSIWLDGVFNGGEFGDKNLKKADTVFLQGTWNNGLFRNGKFGGPFSQSVWNNGVFEGGIFEGGFSLFTNTPLGNVVWNDGTFNNGEFSGSARWKNGTFNSGKFKSVWGVGTGSSASNYAWEDGLFNGGIFGDVNGATYGSMWNSTWYNGVFTGGLFQGKVWNNGVFTGGTFIGMTENGASSSNYFYDKPMDAINYPENFVLSLSSDVSNKNWYGMWRNGTVADNIETLANKVDSKFKNIKKFKGEKTQNIELENVLWINGTFSSTSGKMKNSVWLNGIFNRGIFINSNFNPYTPRWNFDDNGGGVTSLNKGVYKFELSNSCVWNNGTLDNSTFNISEWRNGNFLFGTMSGGLFKNGVSNYMNAYNVMWENGRWRNGNWFGSDFTFKDNFNLNLLNTHTEGETSLISPLPYISTTFVTGEKTIAAKPGKDRDIFIHTAIRHGGTSSSFIGGLFEVTFDGATTSYLQNNDVIKLYNAIPPISSTTSTTSNGGNNKLTLFLNPSATYSNLTSNLGTSLNIGVEFNNYSYFGYSQDMSLTTKNQNLTGTIGTYSAIVNGYEVLSKYGNGSFNSGIWENGVWNNGIRNEEYVAADKSKLFDKVDYYQLSKDVWQIILTGSNISNINSFKIGDDVSIGNIVLIDINGNRKLIKDKFKVVDIDIINKYLYINTVINFPVRKIEIDSHRHKIKVTKNVWLSGLFLNGNFEGVWNNGYFKGFPSITEMIHTNFIDGTFDGGHFLADTATYSDSITGTLSYATYSTGVMQNANILTNIENESIVMPSTTNRFSTYMDINYPVAYGNYLTAEEWRLGSVSLDSSGIQSNNNNNPYIWGEEISYDVLSSTTRNLIKPNVLYDFKFGTKFTEYQNILTDEISGFSDIKSPDRLELHGWSFSTGINQVPLTATQTTFLASDNDFTNPHRANNSGTPLNQLNIDIQATSVRFFIRHNNQINVEKLRYTRIDIDIENVWNTLIIGGTSGYISPEPSIATLEGPKYVDYAYRKADTFKVSKFFFNRPDTPLIQVGGSNNFGLRTDNLKYIELDMIPFIDYAKTSINGSNYINFDVQVPLFAISPFIDYKNTDFSFIDNISFQFAAVAVSPTTQMPPPKQKKNTNT